MIRTPSTPVMSGIQLPVFTTIPIVTHHQILLRQVRDARCVKSLDPVTLTLSTFPWYVWHLSILHDCAPHVLYRPVIGQERVVPSLLREHRQSHQFSGPCCLCPLFEPNGQRVFTEAAMFIARSGRLSGEYVAQCAKGLCGYSGKPPVSYAEPGTHSPAHTSAS
jgi:hypothetical protein